MPGMLSELNVQAFHQLSAPQLLSSGMLRLYGLRFQDELIAVLHTLYARNSIYCYLQGFDPAYAFFSPGAQMTAAVIEDGAAKAMRTVDFLRGREPYKYEWGARDRFTSSIRLSREAIRREPFLRLAA
jgi:CelD/BcsL family acetyltransferase involved in cellulose biosynthesis